jgi:O-acetylhomoserine (thiol)-lyase
MATVERKFGFNTRQLHAGYEPEATTGSRAAPIYQTTAYDLQSTERASRLFALQEAGNIYTRIGNPTSNIVERRLADLEGGVGALEVSSGHAAQTTAIFAICEAGDHIVSSSTLYGGTVSQFRYTFPRLGINVTLVDPSDPENFRKAIQPNTKLIFGETISNPFANVFPFEEVSRIADEFRIPLMIDNTAATPYLCRPFEWGAHIITHSTSKYIGGHGTSLGGAIVDSGKFKWSGSERHKNFNTPDPSYHDVVYAWLFNEPQIHDDGILFTADYLPAGTYVLTYTLVPLQAGEFRVLPAHAWQSFFPEVQGTSAGTVFEITP